MISTVSGPDLFSTVAFENTRALRDPNVWPPGEPVPSNQHPVLTIGPDFWDPGSDELKQATQSPFTSLQPCSMDPGALPAPRLFGTIATRGAKPVFCCFWHVCSFCLPAFGSRWTSEPELWANTSRGQFSFQVESQLLVSFPGETRFESECGHYLDTQAQRVRGPVRSISFTRWVLIFGIQGQTSSSKKPRAPSPASSHFCTALGALAAPRPFGPIATHGAEPVFCCWSVCSFCLPAFGLCLTSEPELWANT